MKKVSVIVPAYNAEKYLKECLDSICAQTYPALEIIVVDDGSKDATASIIKNCAEQDVRIIPFYNENHGVSYSRNFGLEHCTGEYVTFVDADDLVARDFANQMVHDLEESDADMAVIGVAKSRSFQPELFTSGTTLLYEEPGMLEQVFGVFEGFVWNKTSPFARIYSLMYSIWCIAKKQFITAGKNIFIVRLKTVHQTG